MIELNAFEAYEDSVRDTTKQLDFWRLLFIRSRRMLLLSARLLEQFEVYAAWVKFLDHFLRILALYQACVLIPRFLINILYIAQHMHGPAPDDMVARCWEAAYDFGWIMNGVLAAFILVGPLAPLVVYLPVLTPSYQLCVHSTRFLIDYYRNDQALEKNQTDLMRLAIRMGVSVCVISTGMVLLLGSANPVIPFLAATLAVAVTIIGKMLSNNLASDASYVKQSIFASKPTIDKLEQKEEDYPLVLHEKSC